METARLLADRARGRWFVMGHALGPFSMPILLMGEAAWMDLLLFGNAARRRRLLRVTTDFCVAWAKALLAAGCDAVALAEPMASPTMLTREQATRLVFPTIRRVVRTIGGPVILWTIGAVGSVADLVPDLGVRAVFSDPTDDLREVKRALGGRIALLGGLNDLAMLTWSPSVAESAARRALELAAPGGAFVLSHQNEIPVPVGDDLLAIVVEAARKWGRYDGREGTDVG